MSELKINAALVTAAVAALGSGFTNKTAFEGKDFTPPANTAWAALFNLRASADVVTLGVGGQDEHTGVFQIDVSVPENSGTAALLGYGDTLRAYFVAGRCLTYQTQCVYLRRCDISAIRRVDGWLRISASVSYLSRSTRPEV